MVRALLHLRHSTIYPAGNRRWDEEVNIVHPSAVEFFKCYLPCLVDYIHYPHKLVGLIQCHICIMQFLFINTNLLQNYGKGMPFTFTPRQNCILLTLVDFEQALILQIYRKLLRVVFIRFGFNTNLTIKE